MPTYEYRCADCGHTFDAVQAFTDDALTECPKCSGRLKKVFGNVGIAFKGSGFYRNDSRSGSKSTSSSSHSSGASGGNGNGSGKGSASESGSGSGASSDGGSTSPSKAGATSSSSD